MGFMSGGGFQVRVGGTVAREEVAFSCDERQEAENVLLRVTLGMVR